MKPVEGYEDLFSVTEDGQVWSHRTKKFLKPTKLTNKAGKTRLYITTQIGGRKGKGKFKSMLIHRLVAKAFIPNPDNKPQVNHINGIQTDNRVANLERVTAKENMQHAFRTGLAKNCIKRGTEQKQAKLTEENVHYIRTNYVPYSREFGTRALAKKFDVKHSSISRVLSAGNQRSYTNIA